jgi:ABC-type antimicrobial peptide transport system permease subunit
MKSFTRGHLKAGLDSVRGAKMRNFWTMFGIIIGVTSVITIVGIGEGVKQQVSHQLQQFGADLITVRPAQFQGSSSFDVLSGLGISGTLSSKDAGTVARVKAVGLSAPLAAVAGTVRNDQDQVYRGGVVLGTGAQLPLLLNQGLSYGSFFSAESDLTHAAVIGQGVAQGLFHENIPLGRSFSVNGHNFIVGGIMNSFISTPLSQQINFNQAIFIPYQTAEQLTNGTALTYEILVKPADPKQTAQTVSAVRQALTKAHGGQSDFSVLKPNQNLSANNAILDLLTRLIAGVAAISLIVGGIGIMDVMLVSVTERLHEIGIRKAVGATNRQILSQFMIESGLLSLTGGVIGIILSLLIDLGLRIFTTLQPQISWPVVLLATLVSLLVGVVFGSVPALKAARKHPIEALRSSN